MKTPNRLNPLVSKSSHPPTSIIQSCNPCNQEALALMALNPPGKNTGCSQDGRPSPPRQPGENPQPLQPCVASGPLERESNRVPDAQNWCQVPKSPRGTQRRDKEEKTKLRLRKLEAGAAGMPHARGVPVRPCSYTSTMQCPEHAGPRQPVPPGCSPGTSGTLGTVT